MSDTYVECLVKKKQSGVAKAVKVLLIVLTSVCAIFMMVFGPILFFAALIFAAGAYFLNLFTNVEYEYLYLDREIVVDKVLAKSTRKRVASYSVERMEILAPIKSYHLDNYKNRKVTEVDYSIGEELQPDLRYAMYYEGAKKVILSPSEDFIKALKNVAPRKVFND